MSTDDKLKIFLEENLGIETYEILLQMNERFYPKINALSLVAMLVTNRHDNVTGRRISTLIKQFLESLSIEEAVECINEIDDCDESILFYSRDIELLNIRNEMGATALIDLCSRSVIESSDLNIISILLEHKIDINAQNHNGVTALMYCCRNIEHYTQEKIEAIELLIYYGADVQIVSNTKQLAYDYVSNKNLLPERLVQLLQGTRTLNRTKRATLVENSH